MSIICLSTSHREEMMLNTLRMVALTTGAIVALTLGGKPVSAQTDKETVRKELQAAEDKWDQCVKTRDLSAVKAYIPKIFAPDYTGKSQ